MFLDISKIKLNQKLYSYVFVFSLLIHFGLLSVRGIFLSSDFKRLYDPMATAITQWVKGTIYFPQGLFVFDYGLFHLNYILFVSLVYFLFGEGNLFALIIFQVILSSISFLLVLHFLMDHYYFRWIAALFTCIAFLFFDNISWTIAGSPETFYRSVFLIAYILLLNLYFNKRYGLFFVAALISFGILLFTRFDTIFLFIPIYLLAIKFIISKVKAKEFSSFLVTAIVIISIVAFYSGLKSGILGSVINIYRYSFESGIVVGDLDDPVKIEAYDYSLAQSIAYNTGRTLKLFLLRIYQFVNIVPPFWSRGHQVYYAFHMSIFYILAIFGFARVWKTKDWYFVMVLLLYISSMILHGLTRVDASRRTTFTSLTFLIMFAGYGFDYLYEKYKTKKLTVLNDKYKRKYVDGFNNNPLPEWEKTNRQLP